MQYILKGAAVLVISLLFCYFWCVWFVDDEEDEHQECPCLSDSNWRLWPFNPVSLRDINPTQ